jgi:2-keto-4-pentenoate hydratase/2-oxohepta-3-ene-1,7-dioic acid hydratase in catechol pathway
MRWVTFSKDGEERLGVQVVHGEHRRILDLSRACPDVRGGMNALLAAGGGIRERIRRELEQAEPGEILPESDVRLLAPVPHPGKIICLGHNYRDHMGMDRTQPPDFPTFFCKTGNTVIGPDAPIVIPPETKQADFEAELAAVIGRRTRRVSETEAGDCIAGYTILNDVSARDYQKRTSQWMIGKSFDTFCPMGPALVTADEIPDPQNLDLELTVNGIRRQKTRTGRMIFPIPFLIACLSAVMTLEPGDIIATGTPSRIPPPPGAPEFLQPGDLIHITIEGIGRLVNPVIGES